MKNKFFTCLLILVTGCVLLFSSCIKEHVTGVTLNKTTLGLLPDESETLIATVYPDDATNRKVTWKSSNSQVATVTDNGLVTAVTDGNALITATTKDGKKTATCSVIVDYRNKWVGEYMGEHMHIFVARDGTILAHDTRENTIFNVSVLSDSCLRIDAWEVKINADGCFKHYDSQHGHLQCNGNIRGDSINMISTYTSPGATSKDTFKGKKTSK